MCAVAIIDRGFNDVAHPHRRISFHSQFLCWFWPPKSALVALYPNRPPVVPGLFVIATRRPSNKDARARGDDRLATSDEIEPLPPTVSRPPEVVKLPTNSAEDPSWKETAEAFRTSWDKVFDAVEHVVTFGLEHRVLGQIDAIGVDEIQYAKGHKYLTLVYQIDLDVTRLLWVGRERTIESFQGFFTVIGDELASKIVFVCSDMWEPYLKVIREKCSEALHILDRFHIVAKMNKALDEVRAGESRRMASEGGVPVLKKSRWLLLKREENLKTEQRFRLRDLLRYNLKTVRAYLLKEAFQQLWDYNSPAWAGKFLDDWCRQVMRSRIEPMKKIARSLRQHRELILNYFRAQKLLSSGVVEGLNNKAKVTMRKSYGFRTFRCLELALYHSLGKLPEPESTHEFF